LQRMDDSGMIMLPTGESLVAIRLTRYLLSSWLAITASAIIPAMNLAAQSPTGGGACAVITPGDIAKATGLTVSAGTEGKPVPGTLGRCTWSGAGNTKVILTLADAQHMQLTIKVQQGGGGTDVAGLGSKAVAIQSAAFTGGGYIVSVLDNKGGFGVSILGKDGTRERAVALAKTVAGRR
jgi:hypothetical protein